MLPRKTIRELLEPFRISISDNSIDSLVVYLDLLLRWNQKINLTAIRTPEESITRHFGESFLLSSIIPLEGSLLDIGSGAGFPGLAVKLIAPSLEVTLLEPVAKKRAFLKEVARMCELNDVNVLPARFEEYAEGREGKRFDTITTRAVGGIESLIPAARDLLKPGGSLCLWVGTRQAEGILAKRPELNWEEPVAIPMTFERQILRGIRGSQ